MWGTNRLSVNNNSIHMHFNEHSGEEQISILFFFNRNINNTCINILLLISNFCIFKNKIKSTDSFEEHIHEDFFARLQSAVYHGHLMVGNYIMLNRNVNNTCINILKLEFL